MWFAKRMMIGLYGDHLHFDLESGETPKQLDLDLMIYV